MTSGGLSRDFNSRLGEVSSAFDKKVEVLGEKMADISDQFEEMGMSSLNLHLVLDRIDLSLTYMCAGKYQKGFAACLCACQSVESIFTVRNLL
jgi:hypothetical protein